MTSRDFRYWPLKPELGTTTANGKLWRLGDPDPKFVVDAPGTKDAPGIQAHLAETDEGPRFRDPKSIVDCAQWARRALPAELEVSACGDEERASSRRLEMPDHCFERLTYSIRTATRGAMGLAVDPAPLSTNQCAQSQTGNVRDVDAYIAPAQVSWLSIDVSARWRQPTHGSSTDPALYDTTHKFERHSPCHF
jgi:hypothetical protein